MGVKAFKFASPGIFLNEIDQSQLPTEPAPVGPIIIGRSQRGPAMRPITVASYEEFVQTFGEPVAGGDSSGDVWRSGTPAGPTYGGYAAQAWLANNPTVTYVRLLGVQSDTATSGYTGWSLNLPGVAVPTGSYGLFVFPSSSATTTDLTGTLAAIWYCQSAAPILSGTLFPLSANTTQSNGVIVLSDPNGAFRVQMSGTAYPGVDGTSLKTFDFNPTSGKFIRKVFNTNPQNVNTGSVSGLSRESSNYYGYWLGETFENDITNNIFESGASYSGTQYAGIILPLKNFGTSRSNQPSNNNNAARTGWIISQASAGTVLNFSPASQQKLFRFISLDTGDWIRNNLKITINNITPPQNDAQKYGTFDVEVRAVYDTDSNKKIVESFVGCSLDPSSPDYIARKIGDYYYEWDDTERVLKQIGTYPNNSKFIRVNMYSDDLPASAIPFGVLGPIKPIDTINASATGSNLFYSTASCFGSDPTPKPIPTFTGSGGTTTIRFQFRFPNLRTRLTSSEDGITSYKLADWGATTTRGVSSILYNDGVNDLLRIPTTGSTYFINGTVDNTSVQYAWTFSMDNLILSGTSGSAGLLNPVYYYNTSAKSGGTSFTATGSALLGGTYADLLSNGVNSFTTVFQGGTDGFNVLEREPLRNTAINSSTSTNDTDYVYYTYRRAIDTVRDPENVEGNLITIPGLAYEPLTQYLTQIAEHRGDVLAVIDASGQAVNRASYVTQYEYSDDNYTIDRVASPDAVISQIKNRNLNSSYGATYYPWVQISDSTTGKVINVPPSIVAVGAMSYTDKVQAPWFAPAGFNRGGLSTGNAGVNVVNVLKKLSQADRDKLYPVNINPIASFPNEGIVIFGQKTLQATPSALDRINVRRLMLYIKRGINLISKRILFEPNVENTWNNFKDQADPFLADVKARFGLTDYKLVLDGTTTTPDLIDQNIMYAKIFLKPARAIEYIAIDFFITKTGANFNA